MGAELLSQAFMSTSGVLAGVSVADFSKATPCASWRVRELINHVVGGPRWYASFAVTGAAPSDGSPQDAEDFSAGDFRGTFASDSERCVAAFSADGAMERMMRLPFGELPGAVYVNIAAVDTFAHGWDLAKATGQSTDLDPELAAHFLAFSEAALPDAFRGPEGQAPFGRRATVSESASMADRLAAFLGRQV
jgi:uncharacterized protein (TIGR03086 family)